MSNTESPRLDAASESGPNSPVDMQASVYTEVVLSKVAESPVKQGLGLGDPTVASLSASTVSDSGSGQDMKVENDPGNTGGTHAPGVDAGAAPSQPTGPPLGPAPDPEEAVVSASPSLIPATPKVDEDMEAKNRYDSETIQKFLLDKSVPEDEGDKALFEKLKQMEHEPISAPYQGKYGQNSLHISANRGLLGSATTLLEAGASLSAVDDEGCTPLHLACREGHVDIVALFLRSGADINAKDLEGDTPLQGACWNKHEEVVKLLLENGSDTQETDKKGWAPLHWAAYNGHAGIMGSLLGQDKTNIDAVNQYGDTAMHLVANDGVGDAVRLLISHGSKAHVTTDSCKWYPLHCAAQNGHEDIVQLLLDNGADNYTKDNIGQTPLALATKGGHTGTMKKLLEHRSEKETPQLEIANEYGVTPLAAAALWNNEAGFDLLLKSGAKHDTRSNNQANVLMIACKWRNLRIAQAVLHSGKFKDIINDQDEDGDTALHRASRYGHSAIVELLLQHKVKVDIKNTKGQTALHLASVQGYENIVQLLLSTHATELLEKKDDEGQTALHLACLQISKDVELQDADDLGPEVNGVGEEPDDGEKTKSAPGRHDAVVSLLLEKGANPEAKTNKEETALHLAARHSDCARVRSLIGKMKKELNGEDADHKTALDVAFDRRGRDDPTPDEREQDERGDTVRCLLSVGNITFSQSKSDEVLTWAAENRKRHDIARMLFSNSLAEEHKHLGSHDWSAIEWAAYLVKPRVLWLLLSNSKPTPETDRRRKSALELVGDDVLASRYKSSPAGKKGDEASKLQTRKLKNSLAGTRPDGAKDPEPETHQVKERTKGERREDKDRQTIRDILQNPPPTLTSKPREPFLMPDVANIPPKTESFDAGIVQFYERDGESGFFRRHRTVKEVIYDPGLKGVKEEMTRKWKEVVEAKPGRGKSASGASNLQEMVIHGEPKFTWVHLPATNIVWMNDLLKRIMIEKEGDGESKEKEFYEASSFLRDSWFEIPDRTSPSRIMRPRYVSNQTGPEKSSEQMISALYMPYLSFSMQCREGDDLVKFNEKYRQSEDEKTSLKSLQAAKGIYRGLLEDYEDRGMVIHGSSTLDEAYYHFSGGPESTKDQRHRNETQVVTKNWLITSGSHSIDGTKDSLLTGILNNLSRQADVGGRHSQPRNPEEMSKIIVDYCIGLYERAQPSQEGKVGGKDQPDEKSERSQPGEKSKHGKIDQPSIRARHGKDNQSIRRIFSDSINRIGMDEANLFEKASPLKKNGKDQAQNKAGSQKEGKLDTDINATLEEAVTLYCRIKDIRDELNILKTIATYQNDVQGKMPGRGSTPAETTAAYIVADITKMELMANRIQEAAATTLAIEQNDIANAQAKIANAQAKEAVKQGRTLMIFTVATILFLPLSFLSSLFALDVASFQQTPGWAFSIIFVVSLVLFAPLASYALYPDEFVQFFVRLFRDKKTVPGSSHKHETDSYTYLPATEKCGGVDSKDLPQSQETTELDDVESIISNNHWARNIPGWVRRRFRSQKLPEDDSKA
ncbi:uncharacterized protein DNG_07956 [Cephalotrichum gorgonifer]|uniref:Uncharacterized protein n=1 Tax=Cephalotrichum gorgonifer TaxID=2041049 RepID=A0AAE8N487_9PEZI|nr:uncharacterized protein DNG_07956 [Cephalotrichum gorgonifer]